MSSEWNQAKLQELFLDHSAETLVSRVIAQYLAISLGLCDEVMDGKFVVQLTNWGGFSQRNLNSTQGI